MAASFGYIKQTLVGRCRHSVGEVQACVHPLLLAIGLDQPDLARLVGRRWVGHINVPVVQDHKIVAPNTFCDHRGFVFGVIGQNLLRAG